MPAEAVAVSLTVGPGLRPSDAWRVAEKTSSIPSNRGSLVGQAQSRMNDTELIREAQRGNHAAFEELVRQYDSAVLRLAYHLTRSEQDAQDIYQDAFLKAYRNINNFRFECSFLYLDLSHRYESLSRSATQAAGAQRRFRRVDGFGRRHLRSAGPGSG